MNKIYPLNESDYIPNIVKCPKGTGSISELPVFRLALLERLRQRVGRFHERAEQRCEQRGQLRRGRRAGPRYLFGFANPGDAGLSRKPTHKAGYAALSSAFAKLRRDGKIR